MQWLFLLAAIITAVAGQVMLKLGASTPTLAQQATDWHTLVGLACYGGSAIGYIIALRRIPISVALPCTALSYFLVAGLGHYAFNETVGPQKLAALAIIGIGVVLLATA